MLEVLLLGPAEVSVAGNQVSLSPLERNLLAILALAPGTVVSTERIIDSLWGDRGPVAPRSRVQGLVSGLRRKVGDVLVTRHPGYLLDPAGTDTDIRRLHELVAAARRAGTPAAAAEHLRGALALWRGESLDGVSAAGVDVDRARLDELRVGLLENRFEAELQLGQHAELVAELTAAVAAHPLRERLTGHLMLALYRSHRQADALAAYQALRQRLADELGSDPCADLRELHARILRGDDEGRPPPAPTRRESTGEVRPAQLPACVGHFTGRDTELERLSQALRRPGDEPRVLVVSGVGGLGKTALAVRWAHATRDRFPDGQIFVDLHSREPDAAVTARSALGAVLTALGVARTAVPATLDQRSALYRTLVSGRRVLVLADDAGSIDQVLPLVPPGTASQLVVTSRRRLTGLAAHHVVQPLLLEPLSPDHARDLLERIVGATRLRGSAAIEVLRWCGGYPLAIRAVGAKLAARPGQPLGSFAAELRERGEDLLGDDDPRSVRAALTGAHRTLSPAAAHLFAELGRYPNTSTHLEFTPAAIEPAERRVRRLLDELIAVHLVAEAGPDRYRLHDLVHRFARECGGDLLDRDAVDEWARHAHRRPASAWPMPTGLEADSKSSLSG